MEERQDPFDTDELASDSTPELDREAFDIALLQSALSLAGSDGWHRFSLVDAAREAGLPVDAVRSRYQV